MNNWSEIMFIEWNIEQMNDNDCDSTKDHMSVCL